MKHQKKSERPASEPVEVTPSPIPASVLLPRSLAESDGAMPASVKALKAAKCSILTLRPISLVQRNAAILPPLPWETLRNRRKRRKIKSGADPTAPRPSGPRTKTQTPRTCLK